MNSLVSVSVVIPCYRCSGTIDRCVASVAAQSILPLELILVEDCSADATRAALNNLLSMYPSGWIRLVLLDKNIGAASARNVGWEKALGDFVAFLDADDSWHPRKIELQYQFMRARPGVAVSGHDHVQMDAASREVTLGANVFQDVAFSFILLKNPFVTPSFMVRRDLPVRFLEGRRHMEDHFFLMQVSGSGLGVAKIRQPLASIHKNIFGDSGLSSDLWSMQHCELQNYSLLVSDGKISYSLAIFFKMYSCFKFLRRCLIVFLRKCYSLIA